METLKTKLLECEMLEFHTEQEDLILLFLGHGKRFCLSLNGKCILSTKTFKPIETKLRTLGELTEQL